MITEVELEQWSKRSAVTGLSFVETARLIKEVKRLREALKRISNDDVGDAGVFEWGQRISDLIEYAEKALNGEEGK